MPTGLNIQTQQAVSLQTGTGSRAQLDSGQEQNVTLRAGQAPKVQLNAEEAEKNRLSLGNSIPVPVKDYDLLDNKPKINGVTLQGDKTSRQLKIKETDPLTNLEIEEMLNTVFN